MYALTFPQFFRRMITLPVEPQVTVRNFSDTVAKCQFYSHHKGFEFGVTLVLEGHVLQPDQLIGEVYKEGGFIVVLANEDPTEKPTPDPQPFHQSSPTSPVASSIPSSPASPAQQIRANMELRRSMSGSTGSPSRTASANAMSRTASGNAMPRTSSSNATSSQPGPHGVKGVLCASPDVDIAYRPAFGFSGDSAQISNASIVVADDTKKGGLRDSVRGQIALIKRGGTTFHAKAKAAQDAGAVALLIADKDEDPLFSTAEGPVRLSAAPDQEPPYQCLSPNPDRSPQPAAHASALTLTRITAAQEPLPKPHPNPDLDPRPRNPCQSSLWHW